MAVFEKRDTHVALCDGTWCDRESCPKGQAWRKNREQAKQSGRLPTPQDRERESRQGPTPEPPRPAWSEGQDAEIVAAVSVVSPTSGQGIPAGDAEAVQADRPVVRKRGRPVGARDSKPRKNARVIDDLMPGRVLVVPTETREPEAETLAVFARSVLNDEKVRKSILERAQRDGLTPTEWKTLGEWAANAPEEIPGGRRDILEVATPLEVRMIANIARRAMGQPEAGILMPGSRVPRTNAAILASGELSAQ